MNLREETIKVLREIAAPSSAETRDELANTINRDRHLASGLLSRLEAGSGEETGLAQEVWNALRDVINISLDVPPDKIADPDFLRACVNISRRNLRTLLSRVASFLPPAPLNQEGGDAAGPSEQVPEQRRRDVATPAPGENSERVEAEKVLDDFLHTAGAYLTLPGALSSLIEAALAAKFAAGRRSMREEAAKWHDDEALRRGLVDDRFRRMHEESAAAIRSIPEKQSS